MLLEQSERGALLCFDMVNIRYISATHIGTWAMDKLARFTLLCRGYEPIVWDFGSAARHHELYCPWLEDRTPAGISTMRGAMSPESGRAEDVAAKVRRELDRHGLAGDPLGVDVVEPVVMFALQAAGIDVVDGQQLMQRARVIKTQDEIVLLDTACMMVDAAYEHLYQRCARECVRMSAWGWSTRSCMTSAPSTLRGSMRSRGAGESSPARVQRPGAATGRSCVLRHPP